MNISATEKIFMELSQRPEAPQPKPSSAAAEPKKIAPTRADVNELIQRQRVGTPQELEAILANARALRLTDGERQQLSVDVTIAMAQRARQVNNRRDDPGARFIAQTLGLLPTPFGLVEREFIEGLLRDGARNIARCKRHQPPRCECWSSQRAILWQAQSVHGDKSPQSWAAVRVYQALEDLELSSRPERHPSQE
jgi:hypothetical protein